MSASTRERIINYLGAGASQTIAAEAAGVTDAYVSQLLLEPGVAEAVAAKKSGKLEQHLEIDDTIEKGEKAALRHVVRRLDSPLVPFKDALQAFSVLNSARKKAEVGGTAESQIGARQVVIMLPKAAQVMLTMNSENQVVDIGGRSIAPLPSKVLPMIAKEIEANRRVLEVPQLQAVQQEQPQHVTDFQEKVAKRDEQRALSIMEDIEMTINGVQVVL